MQKDYYKILGITEFESYENIKRAYHKLARTCHPDIAGNSNEAINRFKEINEAYQILSNKVKKEEYDKARKFYNYAKNSSKTQSDKETQVHKNENLKDETKFDWYKFFNKKNDEKKEKKTPQKGEDIYTDLDITIYEALTGCVKTINMLQTTTCPKCKGHKFINGTICPECNGRGEKKIYKKFTIKVPAEVKDGSKIRLAGEGSVGQNGGLNGDLYIVIHVQEIKNNKIDGLNVYKTIPITPFEAVLGTTISISTISGSVNFKIQPNTQSGQKIRLSKCGIVQNDKVGDMIVTVEIRIPKNLSSEEISLYKKLEEISSSNIRDSIYDR